MPLNPWKDFRTKSDANGQKSAAYWKTTYYIRDAQGNMMSIYRLNVDEQQQTASYTLTERPIYGSGRLGVDKTNIEFIGYTPPTNGLTNHVLGLKQYEGSNHLGNVLTTFSDKKIPVENNGVIAYYNADVTSSTDSAKCYFETYPYKVQNLHWLIPNLKSLEFVENELLRIHNRYYYPFGVTMKGRDFNSSTSRFGFNSMEKIEETETMDFGARLLDGDLGVWLALDPLMAKYPSLSPYAFCANNPILFVDYDGRDYGIVVEGNRITIVANIYTTTSAAYDQAFKAIAELNDIVKNVNIDGQDYYLSFDIKVAPPPISSPFYVDKIGNAYFGTIHHKYPKNKEGQIRVEGGNTDGRDFQMFHLNYPSKHAGFFDSYNMGNFPEFLIHEILHNLGLDDIGGKYYSDDGRMNYVGNPANNFKLNPVSNSDVLNIIKYAIDNFGNNEVKVKVYVSGDDSGKLLNAKKISVTSGSVPSFSPSESNVSNSESVPSFNFSE